MLNAGQKPEIMKLLFVKRNVLLSLSSALIAGLIIFSGKQNESKKTIARCCNNPAANHVCVMKTILGIDTSQEGKWISTFKTPEKVEASVKKGLDWINKAQANDGGWGAGTHTRQDIMDPHAVPSDPATTSLVAMSLLRTDNTLEKGSHSKNLKRATEFLLKAIENCPAHQVYITTLTNTQPQTKLGRNIDVILTAQFFTNILRYSISDSELKKRIEKALDKCVIRIQQCQDADGSWKDGGWAPVLQSAMANNALEQAQDRYEVKDEAIANSRKYQANNVGGEGVKSDDAAGVPLYAAVSAQRATATETKEVEEILPSAFLGSQSNEPKDEKVISKALQDKGITREKADRMAKSYTVNQLSTKTLEDEDIWSGFGNNGGEEYLSYMMTSEALSHQDHDKWVQWRQSIEPKFKATQNPNGSWSGQHCITSPVFCTAAVVQAWNQ